MVSRGDSWEGRGRQTLHSPCPSPLILEKSGLKAIARETRLQRGFGSASRTISGALVLGDPRLRPLPDGWQTAVYPSSLLDALRVLPTCIRCSEAMGQVHRRKDSGALVRPLGYHPTATTCVPWSKSLKPSGLQFPYLQTQDADRTYLPGLWCVGGSCQVKST